MSKTKGRRKLSSEEKKLEARNAYAAKRAQKLQERTITDGDRWQHFEGGMVCIVAGDARMENSGEPCVVYAAVHNSSVWVRLRSVFLNEVTPKVPRFRRVHKKDAGQPRGRS
jgi:hypothetical protein